MKFVDDLSVAKRINLETDLMSDLDRPRPLNSDERFETKITDEANALQQVIDNLTVFSRERQMVINS